MISAFTCLPRPRCWFIKMRTSDVTQLMDLALGLWFPFVRIMAFLRYVPVLDNSALTVRVRIILSLALAIIITPLIPHPVPHDLDIAQQPDPDGGANFMGHVIRADVSVFVSGATAGRANSLVQYGDEHGGDERPEQWRIDHRAGGAHQRSTRSCCFLPWTGICCW